MFHVHLSPSWSRDQDLLIQVVPSVGLQDTLVFSCKRSLRFYLCVEEWEVRKRKRKRKMRSPV